MGKRISTHKTVGKAAVVQQRRTVDRRRGSAHQRGYTKAWSRYSQDRLKRFPLCVKHEERGLTVQGECTDHIIPVLGPDDPLFWDETNHQTLCDTCHSEKTAAEDGGFGNVRARR